MANSIAVTRQQIHSNIRAELKSEIPLVVTFEKTDGEIREMTCTTNLNQIPPSEWPDKKLTEHLDNSELTTYRVYDLQKQGWRSFRLDSIIRITHGSLDYILRD
jgi:hypothetical protein